MWKATFVSLLALHLLRCGGGLRVCEGADSKVPIDSRAAISPALAFTWSYVLP